MITNYDGEENDDDAAIELVLEGQGDDDNNDDNNGYIITDLRNQINRLKSDLSRFWK